MSETAVYAAGAVVWRLVAGKPMLLVVHRTVYAVAGLAMIAPVAGSSL